MNDEIKPAGLTDTEQATLSLLYAQLLQKAPRNFLRACYYDGKRALRQVGSVIPPQYYKLGLTLGWSATAVDKLARRCNLDSFVWPDGKLDDLGFAELAEGNNLYTETSGALTSSLIHGVVFAVTTKGRRGEPAALVHFKDALNATGSWNARTRGLDALLSITDRDPEGKPTGIVLYLRNMTITATRERSGWRVVDRSPHRWGVPAEALAYKPRTGRAFGNSRISRTVMSLHDQALRTVIRMEGHADIYSFPELWLLGADEALFKNADGSQKAAWQVLLGRIKAVPDNDEVDPENARADVKQFRASDPTPHILQYKLQAQTFGGETSIPLTSLGVSDQSNPASDRSYIASREDLIAEAEGATDDWGPGVRRTALRLLAIANGHTEIPREWLTIAPKWRSPLYLSRAEAADAGTKQLSAVPGLAETTVGLELLGLDPQQIARFMAEKQAASPTDPDVIRAAADAMGVLIRSGVEPTDASRLVGFDKIRFTGAVPVTLRQPKDEAANLEGSATSP